LSGHDLSEARDKYHCSVPNKANIVVTGIDLYLRKYNARYCSLRNAVNLENVHAGGTLNKLSDPIASLLVSQAYLRLSCSSQLAKRGCLVNLPSNAANSCRKNGRERVLSISGSLIFQIADGRKPCTLSS
jgi:hypothetical protein